MKKIYQEILQAKAENRKLLAILLDPDKIEMDNLSVLVERIIQSPATHIFIGGSIVETNKIDEQINFLKEKVTIPIVLF
ncbi:MAG: geranylgeranylglyceryl/heptaprenylglyceryl phosphate synthase, partial [Bacteroidetes bacterium HGW-Bacteroidetes-23]